MNGDRVLSFVDAGIGCGDFGWRVVSFGDAGSVTVHSIEAFDVVVT